MNFRPFVTSIVVIVGSLSLGYLIVNPVFRHANDINQSSSCLTNLKQIALAASQYSEDYDSRLPAISRRELGWADALQPYLTRYSIFHCPTVGKRDSRDSDYFFNARLANLPHAQLKFPDQTIALGDGLAHGGTNSHFSELPFDWKTDENSPARRHWEFGSYAFADGHVKMIRPEKVTKQSPLRGDADWEASFAVR